MNKTFIRIIELIKNNDIKVSAHGYDELAEDGILVKEILANVKNAVVIEDYPKYPKGHCMLVLQKDLKGRPIHVVWGIPRNANSPAVLITAYRPDPKLWTNDFLRRKK